MGLFGSIAGGALGAVGSIFGGISASKAMKKVKRNIEAQKKANEDWYNRRYNEDATQRADAQRILTMTEESIKNRNKQAAATAAVMGGTEESVAAAKAANSEALMILPYFRPMECVFQARKSRQCEPDSSLG